MTPAATVWWGMVLLASGIVDEEPARTCGGQYSQLAGVEPLPHGCGLGFGTLLGFEESHPLPWAPWWGGGVASFVCCARECVVGVGGCGG